MEKELWKQISGIDGEYYISSWGRVKNKDDKILKQNRWFEYLEIQFKVKGKKKHFKIHRLVAEAFIPNPENKKQINHIDGITIHNEVSNLEWVTNKENMERRHKWEK